MGLRKRRGLFGALAFVVTLGAVLAAGSNGQLMPAPEPFPPIPAKGAVDSIAMQDPATFAAVEMDFPIAKGPFQATWESIAARYPGAPAWLRQAKFGIWVHFGPQSAGESGDWFARRMYQPGTLAYKNHLAKYGSPGKSGYKEYLHTWNPVKLDPKALAETYKEAGARFLIVQGVHHDNFDNWDSAYQPWNSVNMGPHRDLLGEWAKAAKATGLRYGVAFHHEYTWWWYQPAFDGDGNETLADGKGKWWEGYDPRLLYGIDLREYKGLSKFEWTPDKGIFQNHLAYDHWYATRWALRIEDVINKYDPDFLFTDGDSTGPFSGYETGTGYKCDCIQRVLADFYNKSLERRGKVDTFSIVKFHAPLNGVATTFEGTFPDGIKTDQTWLGENAVGDWFYGPDFVYSARALILYMLEVVSRDGEYAVNVSLKPDGSLDEGSRAMLREVGAWMKVNGAAIYGSKAWVRWGEGGDGQGGVKTLPAGQLGKEQADFKFDAGDFRFTQGADGAVYCFALGGVKAGDRVKVVSLGTGAGLLGHPVRSVGVLGVPGKVTWTQEVDGLEIVVPKGVQTGIAVVFRVN